MKKGKLKYVLGLILATVMLGAAAIPVTEKIVDASSATTYTRTQNADGENVRCQDGYLPETTFDRIGLNSPKDMVIDTVIENGKEVEYGYILNAPQSADPYLLKFKLDDVDNNENTVEKINLKVDGNLSIISGPTGLWIQTTTVNGVTRKEMYIADETATYKETFQPTELDKAFLLGEYTYTYNGMVFRIPFDENNELLLNHAERITEPVQEVSRTDYSMYELKSFEKLEMFDGYQIIPTASNFKAETKNEAGKVIEYNRIVCRVGQKCEERIVPLGQYIMKTSSFGQETVFSPSKVSVDSSGNIFIASKGTDAGMIQMSYSGEFISFFVVNAVTYNWMYQFIKNYGTDEQLEKLNVDKPAQFTNLFIDHNDLVYSVSSGHTVIFDKYSTGGKSILEYQIGANGSVDVADSYVTKDGLIFLVLKSGPIYVCAPTGQIIFYFGFADSVDVQAPNIVGFFKDLTSIMVDSKNRIWVVDAKSNFLQTFVPTDYSKSIVDAIISFNNHDYEQSRKSWEDVLANDSLSVLANDGLGKAYYYDLDFEHSLEYFSVSKNRTLYSNVFWELRNDFLQENLANIILVLIGVIAIFIGIKVLFKKVKKLADFKAKVKTIKKKRWFLDLFVGFRLIKKPNDTFYEIKNGRMGSVLGATIYYVLAIIAFLLHTYCYALPFQYLTTNQLNPSTILFAVLIILAVFVLCNYLVSAINDGEGTFKDIYKFTGYSLLPMIICLPIAVGVSYVLTLNEQVILTILQALAFWGSGIILVIGILETHNYTFSQTVKNIILTIVFMVLFLIICVVVIVMLDQIKTLIETIWKEVKLRAGWY